MFGKLTLPQLVLLDRAVAAEQERTEAVFAKGIPVGSEPAVVAAAVLQAATDFAALKEMREAIEKARDSAKSRKKPGRRRKSATPATEAPAPVQQ